MDEIELIKQKINIVDLIQEYLPLKKAGVNFKSPCPFHKEKTPSFMVSPERGIFHCFGCAVGGDIFKFLMLKEGMEFIDALKFLAKKAGVVLKKESNARTKITDQKERLYEANLKSAEFFHYILIKHELGKRALNYLKTRGITDQTIEDFNLGYAPNSWHSLTNFLHKRNFNNQELIDSGLTVTSKNGVYDRFRGRLMFPLIDIKNQVIGFAGRVLDKSEPKYINTPQTVIFDKSNYLFGLNLTKGEIRTKKQAILTEGEIDMILSYQAGEKNVVASKGTALTEGQIELIKKYAETILLCFDADLAGDFASRRGIEMADQKGLNIKVVRISEGKDPAELIKINVELWSKAVQEAVPIYDYYLDSVGSRFNRKSAEGKKNIINEFIPVMSKISDNITYEHYLQKLSALVAMPEEMLRAQVQKYKTLPSNFSLGKVNTPESNKMNVRSRRELLEEYLLALLLKIPVDLTFVPQFPETIFLSETYRSLYVLLVLYLDSISFKATGFRISDFVKTIPSEQVVIIDKLYLIEIDDKLSHSGLWQKEVATVVGELKKSLIKSSLEKLSAEIKNAQAFDKIEQLEILNRRFRDLSLKLKGL